MAPKTRTKAEFEAQLTAVGTGVKLIGNYFGSQVKNHFRCTCGKEWQTTGSSVLKGRKCGCVTGRKMLDTDDFKKRIESVGTGVKLIGNYLGTQVENHFRCSCGNDWWAKPCIIFQGSRCGCVTTGRSKMTHKTFTRKLKAAAPGVELLEKYKGSKYKHMFKCDCGGHWSSLPLLVMRGGRCGCRKAWDQPSKFYVVMITDRHDIPFHSLVKFGVTSLNTVTDRISTWTRRNKIKNYSVLLNMKTSDCLDMEKRHLANPDFLNAFEHLPDCIDGRSEFRWVPDAMLGPMIRTAQADAITNKMREATNVALG